MATPQASIPLRSHRRSLVFAWLLMAIYAVVFGWLSLTHYWGYQMHALDMGNMGQAAWNTLHGHLFQFTNMRLAYAIEAWNTTTRLSFHVEGLFPAISLSYVLYPHPETLLVLQTVALALGALPTYLLARDVLGNGWVGLTFALAYLLFPALEAMNLYEFHPVALATPLLLCAFLFSWRRRYVPFVVCCLAAMGTKEEIGLTVALFGLYVALAQRQWRVGLAVAIIGVAWSLIGTLVIEHHFRQPGTLTYTRNRYRYLGHGARSALNVVFRHPGKVTGVVFTWYKLGYLLRLLAPVAFLALLAPTVLLLGTPTFALNVLSTSFPMYSGVGHNSAELISVVMIAAILGARRTCDLLRYWFSQRNAMVFLTVLVLVFAVTSQILLGYTPLGSNYQSAAVGSHQKLQDQFVAMVPAGLPVSTQDQLDPHLSSRQFLYLFEDTGRQAPPLNPANYILLDVSAPSYPLRSYELHDNAMQWIGAPGWGVAAARDGLILIKKGARSRTIPPAFYTFAQTSTSSIPHRLSATGLGLKLLGFDVQRLDRANHRTPNLAYTIYLQVRSPTTSDVQPIIWETSGHRVIACAQEPLGLAWLPTSRWKTHRTYQVRMNPLETSWQSLGTLHLYLGFERVPRDPHPRNCPSMGSVRGVSTLGTVDVGL